MKYGAILMDLPWSFHSWSGKQRTPHRTTNDHYDTMPLKDLMALVGGPYLEMFARQEWPGWDVWGNETAKFEVAV